MNIIKRNGTEVVFDNSKIVAAVEKANTEVPEIERLTKEEIEDITKSVEEECSSMSRTLNVEEIQNLVEDEIMKREHFSVARKYITYRYKRALVRKANTTDDQILSLIECANEEVKQENSNKNPTINSVQRDYMAGEVSKDITKRLLLPEDVVKAHEDGIIHFHDSDYFAQHMHNCCLVNLEDMLQNGTVISETMIEKPKSFSTACNVATQIIAQVASSQYGGQSITLSHLAPFVDISRKKYRKIVAENMKNEGIEVTEEQINSLAEKNVKEEIKRGVQILQYQVITLMTTNGQAPFVTVFMYLDEVEESLRNDLAMIIEEVLKQRFLGIKNEKGVYVTPAFPKLIYVLEEDNISEDSPYWYLTELAARCTAKRMVPDYISEKVMKELKEGNCYPCMGCRSFLTVYKDENNKPKFYGRFNQGVVTLNLVDIACSSGKDMDKFWDIFDERLDLCYKALMCRHERLKNTPSDVAPILWQYGALARLKKGETLDKLLYNGYSTISLGYAGLYECVKYMTGKSHTDPSATGFALSVMQHLNDACEKWRKETNIDFSLYGSPIESTTYKFAKCLQKRFGIVEGITDKSYITNSYHVNVREKIDAFDKLSFESQFQKLSPGGAVSYVEVPNMNNNIPAVLAVMKHIYNNIMYAELNTKSDYCMECGYDGEIEIVQDENDKLLWKCPNCGNTNQNRMSVARRTCGYIGTQFWNQGRTQEIKERELHL
ncbi:ribonucleoside-triphosphate reductase [Eubacterium sp. CAG:274]|nr:ribonucleoside-triphosphate reductase [Eubacterium sp. CAG:274]